MNTQNLILCESTRNRVNIFNGDKYKLFFKPYYIDVFQTMLNMLNVQKRDVVMLWQDVIGQKIKDLKKALKEEFKEYGEIPEDDVQRIADKFRGNLGEIFAEKFFTEGYAGKYVKATSYQPVDPTSETSSVDCAKIDARGKSGMNGSLIGIQVKNFKTGNLVGRDVFNEVCSQVSIWDYQTDIEKTFGKSKREYSQEVVPMIIFSFTEAASPMLLDNYNKLVKFIGPNVISKAKIQESTLFFEEIIEALNNVV